MAKREYTQDEITGALGVVDGLGGDTKAAAKRLGYPHADVSQMLKDRDRPDLKTENPPTIKDPRYKFTPERRAAILQLLAGGNTRKTVYTCARIDSSTFHTWLRDDTDFREDVEHAEAQAIADAIANIRDAGADQWQANAWFLERKESDWRAPDVKAIAATVAKIEAALEKLSPDARAEFAQHYQAL